MFSKGNDYYFFLWIDQPHIPYIFSQENATFILVAQYKEWKTNIDPKKGIVKNRLYIRLELEQPLLKNIV